MPPFKKGNPGKPKGAKNKIDSTIKEKFNQLLEGVGIDQLQKDLKSLKPIERLNVIMSLAEYITPKLARTQMEHDIAPELSDLQIRVFRGGPDMPPLANSEKDVIL